MLPQFYFNNDAHNRSFPSHSSCRVIHSLKSRSEVRFVALSCRGQATQVIRLPSLQSPATRVNTQVNCCIFTKKLNSNNLLKKSTKLLLISAIKIISKVFFHLVDRCGRNKIPRRLNIRWTSDKVTGTANNFTTKPRNDRYFSVTQQKAHLFNSSIQYITQKNHNYLFRSTERFSIPPLPIAVFITIQL